MQTTKTLSVKTTKEFQKEIKCYEQAKAEMVNADLWRLKFHLMPPVGWLNDPNGLCQVEDVYHVFFQYSPTDAKGGYKAWGHYTSLDLVNWVYEGAPLVPDSIYDRDGVYSGSAFVEDGKINLFYTGNVKQEGKFDYIYNGREGNTIHVDFLYDAKKRKSADYIAKQKKEYTVMAQDKTCVIAACDYPENYSCHIRDPKLWKSENQYYMILGARTKQDQGACLIYQSGNLKDWKLANELTTKQPFGYMWECPDYFVIGQQQFLSLSPQGLPHGRLDNQNVYQSGYFKIKGSVTERSAAYELGDFTEWDKGFDFYAPQTFADQQGRRILIGWAGLPDIPYENPTVEKGWQHALTVPREITVKDGTLCQNPVRELEQLRGQELHSDAAGVYEIENYAADILLHFHEPFKNFDINIDGVTIVKRGNEVQLHMSKKSGAGRTVRYAYTGDVENMRILVDTSILEIYINQGKTVMTTRFYADLTRDGLPFKIESENCQVQVFSMADHR